MALMTKFIAEFTSKSIFNAHPSFHRPFSSQKLARQEAINDFVKEEPVQGKGQVAEVEPIASVSTLSSPAIPAQSPAQSRVRSQYQTFKYRLPLLLDSQAAKMKLFARGPLRSNTLIAVEFVRLIAREQQLIPQASQWPAARAQYLQTFNELKSTFLNQQTSLLGMLGDLTWGRVGRALRVSLEMASFYYIGQLIGHLFGHVFGS